MDNNSNYCSIARRTRSISVDTFCSGSFLWVLLLVDIQFSLSQKARRWKMKGVILAGGTGTRLYPLTKATNKHLLPAVKEPMILNPIMQLISAGINDILVITSKDHMGDVVRLLGSGSDFRRKILRAEEQLCGHRRLYVRSTRL